MTTSNEAHVAVRDLTQRFISRQSETTAFENLNFAVNRGEFVCLLGPSGCGKSTLLRVIAQLQIPTSGSVLIESPKSDGGAHLSMVLQEHGLFPWMSLARNISFPVRSGLRASKKDAEKTATEHLARVGLRDFHAHFPHQVSGGMRQRVSVARSFAMQASLLLMDEPFVFLDYQSRLSLHGLLLDLWQERKTTVFFVTHDVEEAVALADRVLVMSKHPGTLKADLPITLNRPREMFKLRSDRQFSEYVAQLSELLRIEMSDAN